MDNVTGLNITGFLDDIANFNITKWWDDLNISAWLDNVTGLNISGFIDDISKINITKIIKDIIDEPVKEDVITGADLTKYYTKTTTFKVTVTNGDVPLTKGTVVFTVDNKIYSGQINSKGVASAKISKLKPGTHYVFVEYGQASVKYKIKVKKAIITKNVSKKVKKAGKFTVKILNSKGKVYAKQTVKIKFKGKTYKIKTNKKGIATFKLSKKLKVGKYTIKTTYAGLTISNKITVKK